jgi:carbonic anhydrase
LGLSPSKFCLTKPKNGFVINVAHSVPGAAVEAVKFVKNNPLIRKELKDNTTGAVYDIKTGRVTMVEA